jgi:hypothetical protein
MSTSLAQPVRRPWIAAGTATALLAAFWIASFTSPDGRTDQAPRSAEARLRRLFEDNAPGVRALATPMNGLLYLFGERRGAESVAVVSSSTGPLLLFTPELELERPSAEGASRFTANVAAIRGHVSALRQAGAARVLLLPVPTKLSILLAVDPSLRPQVAPLQAPGAHGPATGASLDGRRTAEAYAHLAGAFRDLPGVQVVSLQRLFLETAARGGEALFVPEDTHWTSLGVNLAALAVAHAWRGTEQAELVRAGSLPDRPGDLQNMMALPRGAWFRTHPYEEPLHDIRGAAGPCAERAFLVGTSYSTHRAQHLATQIAKAAGCPVEDLAQGGKGPVATLEALLRERASQLPGAVVIWEFPFRDVMAKDLFAKP